MQPRAKMLAFRDKIIEYRKDTQLAEVESGTANEKDKRAPRPANTSSNVNIAEAPFNLSVCQKKTKIVFLKTHKASPVKNIILFIHVESN